MPEIAGSWPEEGTAYVPGAPMDQVPQAYPPQAPYQTQQPYQQQGYQEPQYHQGQQAHPQQPHPQQHYPQQPPYPQQEQTVPQQAVPVEDEHSALPSEFDHLFRDSAPAERRAISGRQPMVSGPGAAPSPGFQQPQQPAPAPAQLAPQQPGATATYNPPQQQVYDAPPPIDYNNGPFSYDGPPGGGSSGRRTPLIIGAVVAVVAAAGLYLGLSGGGGSNTPSAGGTASTSASPKSTESAKQEADAVYQLVAQAKQLREDIAAGVGKLRSCDISAAQSQINQTAQARANAASQVAQLPVDKISGGTALINALQKAWQDSAASDENYAKAAADFANGGCSKSAVDKDANYKAATSGSGTSASDKSKAADLWNSVMSNYEPSITESDL
jgi:hypothetical protein